MSDPLSAISAVLTIVTITLQSSNVLSGIILTIKEAPAEIHTVALEIDAFQSTVISLKSVLEDTRTTEAIQVDETLANLIANVSKPLNNCDKALQTLTSKLQRVTGCNQGNVIRTLTRSLRWGVSARKEVKELQSIIGNAKLTLITAIELINLLLVMNPVHISPVSRGAATSMDMISISSSSVIDSQRNDALTKPRRGQLCSSNVLRQDQCLNLENSGLSLDTPRLQPTIHPVVPTKEPIQMQHQAREAAYYETFECELGSAGSGRVGSTYRLQTSRSPSPISYFESSSSFYPEQYSIESSLGQQLSVHASIQVQEDKRVQKLFVTYAQSSRSHKRIILSAIFEKEDFKPSEFQYSIYDGQEAFNKALPTFLLNILQNLLFDFELYPSVTNISLPLVRDLSGEFKANLQEVRAAEDVSETLLGREDEILQDIESMGCPTFPESQVAILSRITNTRFVVSIGSTVCLERRVPFASSGLPDTNSFKEYWDDLKTLNTLRNNKHVIRFFGVVLDDSRKCLKGYLHEFPNYHISKVIETAESRFQTVSWEIREKWAMQIVTGITEVHRQGLVAGIGPFCRLYIKSNGSALLGIAMLPRRSIKNRYGVLAPELRKVGSQDTSRSLTFRTDIFALGLILWQLAEHRGFLSAYLCPRSGCTKNPKHACSAEHANPIALPDCSPSIPLYYREMIEKCRSMDPKNRPPAHKLLASFPEHVRSEQLPIGMKEIRTRFPPIHTGASAHCVECGVVTTWNFYRCEVCDIEFCPKCMSRDIHPNDSKHQLIRGGPTPEQSILR